MAERKMKMRTRLQDGVVELQVLITHPMETGLRTDKNTNAKIPPHFIQKVNVELNGKVVVVVNTGPAIYRRSSSREAPERRARPRARAATKRSPSGESGSME